VTGRDAPRRVVVIGNGMAGFRFAQDLVAANGDGRFVLTVIGDEPGTAYNRILLTNLLAGRTAPEEIVLASENWYADHGVTLIAGSAVDVVDRPRRELWLDDGRIVAYDVLVLATGSDAVWPPITGLFGTDGSPVEGAVAFRTLGDCIEIDRNAAAASHVVVLGAGVLGVEAARGLAGRGLDVTLLGRAGRVMDRQLDPIASRFMTRSLAGVGVSVPADGAVEVVADGGKVSEIVLACGARIPADLFVVCCGIAPRVGLARDAGLAVGKGVVVDERMRSVTDPSILAIGECAEFRGQVCGLVAPAWEQARIAAATLADETTGTHYVETSEIVRLKAAGIELACLGESAPGGSDDDLPEGTDVVRYSDSGRGIYQKLLIRDGRLAGAIVLGDTRAVGTLSQMFDRQTPVPADPASLLIVRRNSPATVAQSPTLLPGRATICQCNGVTKAGICGAWSDGARTVGDMAAATRATTGCGTCRDTVQGLIDWLEAADAGTDIAAADPNPRLNRDLQTEFQADSGVVTA